MTEIRAITISSPPIPTISEVESIKEICKVAAYSGFLTSNSRRDDITARTADAFFVVLYGRELGIPAMTALRNIYVINGKPSCSGELLLGMMLKAGVQVETPDPVDVAQKGAAAVRIKRPGGEWRTYTFTREMAKAAGLLGKDTWKSYEPQMMIWRAVSMGAKYECADLTGGMRTIEELAPDTPVNEDGAPTGEIIIEATPFPPESNGSQPPVGHEPDSVRVEQPSAKVVGVQPRPTPPRREVTVVDDGFHDPAALDEPDDPDPLAEFGMEQGASNVITATRPDEDANLYHAVKLVIGGSRTKRTYEAWTVNNVQIPLKLEHVQGRDLNGTAITTMNTGINDLAPSWSVWADRDADGWHVLRIETEMTF